MPVSGLFFLPVVSSEPSRFQELFKRLTTNYIPSSLPPWTLGHRLFRETASLSDRAQIDDLSKTSGPRYLQVLSLSHHPGLSYIAITTTLTQSHETRAGSPASSILSVESNGEPATIISIPDGPPTEDFIQLMISKFGPLWTQRQTLSVSNGRAFEIGDFCVRMGELKQGHGGAQLPKGVVVEVELTGGGEEQDWENGEGMIKAFWDELNITRARECFGVGGLNKGDGTVRQWCEVLRLRG